MTEDDDLYDDNVLPDDPVADDDIDEDDAATPFSEPSDIDRRLPIDHPKTDYDNDATEIYNEGEDEASGADLPSDV